MAPPLRFVCAALALVVSAMSGSAAAYCRSTTCGGDCDRDVDGCKVSGTPLYWPTMCVGFSLQKDGSEHIDFAVFRDVAQRSFVAWSDVDCGGGAATMAFVQLDNVACHKAEYNADGSNANVVLFQDHKWSYTSSDNTLAKTTVTFDLDTGEIFDADIELNHAFNEFTTGDDYVVYDLQSILTHEIGHFIGLDHTPAFDATMNQAYEQGTTELRDLASDDEEAVCAAYPPDRPVKCEPTPRGSFSKLCGDEQGDDDGGCSVSAVAPRTGSGYHWLAMLFAGLALARLRRPS